ncbi:MAG TPA: hypothetical protein VMA98_13270 [Candidatus Acidoferrales bacterium]|nr:hypothetical protein [Candidatus Acidoferrales bacterium]
MNDPILAAQRLPRLAQRAMRDAILRAVLAGHITPRAVVDPALLTFESAVERLGGVRAPLLFAERDRIARELRAFVDGRLAARLRAVGKRGVAAAGRAAAPFDLLVRNRRGRICAIVFRRLPRDGRRLAMLQRVRAAVRTTTRTPVDGVLVYDFARGRALLLDQSGAQRVDRYLRAC